MADNILKKRMERTAKELVAEVYPRDGTYRRAPDGKEAKRGRKFYEAAGHVLDALVAGSTTLVSDLSLSLANLRSLIGEERIRNITGRPRKPPERRPEQMELLFPDAA